MEIHVVANLQVVNVGVIGIDVYTIQMKLQLHST